MIEHAPSMALAARQMPVLHRIIARLRSVFAAGEAWAERERAQLPLWAPVLLIAGIAAWFGLPGPTQWMAWTALWLGIAAGAAALGGAGRLSGAIAWAGLLLAAGCLLPWGKATLVGSPPLARPALVQMEGDVVRIEPLAARGLTRATLRPVARPDLPRLVRVNIADADRPAGLSRGDRIALRVRLMPPAAAAVPGGYDYAPQAYFAGIGATGRALPPVRIIGGGTREGPGIRQRLADHIRAKTEGGAGAIAVTLATGDRGDISEADAEAMRNSGLAHLLSISGLHVTALIGAVILILLRLLALSPGLALRWPLLLIAAGGGAVAGLGYTLLTGAEVPTIRSCVAALLVMLALAAGREPISLRLLAVAALFVLLFWPESAMGPSFQMSFSAVLAIVALHEWGPARRLFAGRDERWWRRLARALLSLVMTGLLIEAVLAPIGLYHFHQTGLLGALANLVAIPLTSFVVMPAEAGALLLDTIGLGAPFWWVTQRALELLLAIAHGVAGLPHAVALLPTVSGAAFALAMAGMLWLLLWRGRVRWLGLGACAIAACLYLRAPVPDLIVTGDGRHLAARLDDGRMAILRDRAGDYTRDMLGETAGFGGGLIAIDEAPGTRCSADLCAFTLRRADRAWRILATRSPVPVPRDALLRDCAAADIVVSDRALPRDCAPRWLKLDRVTLRRTGGVAIDLSTSRISQARQAGDRHPWNARAPFTPPTPLETGRAGDKPVPSPSPPPQL